MERFAALPCAGYAFKSGEGGFIKKPTTTKKKEKTVVHVFV
jgi:hypothetical protein